jgi:hypothetical protein
MVWGGTGSAGKAAGRKVRGHEWNMRTMRSPHSLAWASESMSYGILASALVGLLFLFLY